MSSRLTFFDSSLADLSERTGGAPFSRQNDFDLAFLVVSAHVSLPHGELRKWYPPPVPRRQAEKIGKFSVPLALTAVRLGLRLEFSSVVFTSKTFDGCIPSD